MLYTTNYTICTFKQQFMLKYIEFEDLLFYLVENK